MPHLFGPAFLLVLEKLTKVLLSSGPGLAELVPSESAVHLRVIGIRLLVHVVNHDLYVSVGSVLFVI